MAFEMAFTDPDCDRTNGKFNERNKRLGRGPMLAFCGDEKSRFARSKTFLNNINLLNAKNTGKS